MMLAVGRSGDLITPMGGLTSGGSRPLSSPPVLVKASNVMML